MKVAKGVTMLRGTAVIQIVKGGFITHPPVAIFCSIWQPKIVIICWHTLALWSKTKTWSVHISHQKMVMTC